MTPGADPFARWALYEGPEQKAQLEARNGLLQFEAVRALVDRSIAGFRLTPLMLRELHLAAIHDIYTFAGQFRDSPAFIARNGIVSADRHQPPPPPVQPLVDELCDYVNGNFGRSAVHLAAYVMWRLNWVHPFSDGNGRTSRAASYLVLCARLGFNLPGVMTIPEQIEADRRRYDVALEAADAACRAGQIDVSMMEELLSDLLAAQLVSIHDQAHGAR